MIDFESTQGVEIVTEDTGHEALFVMDLRCTSRSIPGDMVDPPCGPEFEIHSVHFLDPVDRNVLTTFSPRTFTFLVGSDIFEELFERACLDATENGEF